MTAEEDCLTHRRDESCEFSESVWRPVQTAPKALNQKALRMGFLLVSALLTTSSIALLASALLRPSGLNNRALTGHHKLSAEAGGPEVVQTAYGDTARLPCRADASHSSREQWRDDDRVLDVPVLLQWYRGSRLIYSVDSENVPLMQARHTVHSGARDERRLHFSVGRRPYRLSLGDVGLDDEDVYSCVVAFASGAWINASVSLVVVVPPGKPVIKYVSKLTVEESVASVIGPFNEGDRLVLLCEVIGGHPAPSITWHLGSAEMDHVISQVQSEKSIAWVEIERLERRHFMNELTCSASSGGVVIPQKTSVMVDLYLKPQSVSIRGAHGPVSAHYPAEVECEAVGSRPPASLFWYLDDRPLHGGTGSTRHVSSDDVSVSVIRFTPAPNHNGRPLRCRAANPQMPQYAIEDSWTLDVYYKPKVELTLGSHPRQWNIVEGHDLYLECRVDANPRIGDVLWRLDGRDLHPGRHVIMSNQSLALQSVRRDSSGSYTCVATNRVGETQSEPLNIVVKHSPACNQSQTTVYAASRHEEVHVICDVASEPKDVKFRWTFNNSATKHDVTSFTSSGTRSVLYYTARKDSDYGTFQCLANNSVGEMKTPCYFQIVPAGPLNTMYHCAVTNITDVGLQVDCQRKDGTTVGAQEGAMLPDDVAAEASTFRQRHGFQLEVRDLLLDRVLFNSTSEMASFTVTNLPPGTSCVLALYLVNQQGRSKVVQLRTSTLLPSEEKLRSGGDQRRRCCSSLALLVTGAVLLLFLFITAGILVKYRTRLKFNLTTKKREPSTSPENAELNEIREPSPESKFVIPVVKQCAKELPASRENGLTYV